MTGDENISLLEGKGVVPVWFPLPDHNIDSWLYMQGIILTVMDSGVCSTSHHS